MKASFFESHTDYVSFFFPPSILKQKDDLKRKANIKRCGLDIAIQDLINTQGQNYQKQTLTQQFRFPNYITD